MTKHTAGPWHRNIRAKGKSEMVKVAILIYRPDFDSYEVSLFKEWGGIMIKDTSASDSYFFEKDAIEGLERAAKKHGALKINMCG